VPIYPLVFSYYLKKDGKLTWKNVSLFVAGFLGAFLLIALIIVGFGSIAFLQEFIRFVAAGIVALLGIHVLLRGTHLPYKLEQRLENIASPSLFGAVFGLALNPCALPLFLAHIAITAVNAFSFLNILFFGLGVALPPILAAIFGAGLIKWLAKRTRGAYQYLDRVVGAFLLIASAFIVWAVSASPLTAVLASLFILAFFVLLIAPFWKKIFSAKKLRTELWMLTGFLLFLAQWLSAVVLPYPAGAETSIKWSCLDTSSFSVKRGRGTSLDRRGGISIFVLSGCHAIPYSCVSQSRSLFC
jgi:cytochrome c biogenesis protein CcdA